MRQPEDTKTLDLIETQKRGRGRPAVANPLSQAERAKIYRLRKKSKESASVPGRLKGDVAAMTHFQTENLRVALDNANEQIRVLQAQLTIKSDVTKNGDYYERWGMQDAAEIKLLSGDVSFLRKENALLVAEREAAWNEVERFKRDASQKHESDLSVTHHEKSFAYAYICGFNAASDADNPFIFSDPRCDVWWSGRRKRAFLDCNVN